MATIDTINVFIASPEDVKVERNIIDRVIREENEIHYEKQGYKINPIFWEADSTPSDKEWQKDLNEKIKDSILAIFIFWTRIGKYTHEEYKQALDSLHKNKHPQILALFSQHPLGQLPETVPSNNEYPELPEIEKLKKFSEELDSKVVSLPYRKRTYNEKFSDKSRLYPVRFFLPIPRTDNFEYIFRKTLADWFYENKGKIKPRFRTDPEREKFRILSKGF